MEADHSRMLRVQRLKLGKTLASDLQLVVLCASKKFPFESASRVCLAGGLFFNLNSLANKCIFFPSFLLL